MFLVHKTEYGSQIFFPPESQRLLVTNLKNIEHEEFWGTECEKECGGG